MSDSALPSLNTILKVGDGAATEVFTAIAEVTSITPMSGSTEILDASDLSSAWKIKKAGMIDAGQLQFSLHFLPGSAGHQGLMTDWQSRTTRNFQIVFPDTPATTWEIAAIITSVGPQVPANGIITGSFTAEITGQPDFGV